MTELLDALTCFAVGCVLFPLGAWGRGSAETLVAPAILGEDREARVAVLLRGARTCQVVALVFFVVGFLLLLV